MRTLESLHKQEDNLRALATQQANEGLWARRDITMRKLRAVLDHAWQLRNLRQVADQAREARERKKLKRDPMTPRAKLRAIRNIIRGVDQRCLAADFPWLVQTNHEITLDELRKIYELTE